MKRDDILAILSRHRAELQAQFGITSLGLFGSAARHEAHAASDVDVLVDFPGAPSFDQYMGLKLRLEDLLAPRVDLVTSRGLRPQLRPVIEREAIRLA